MAIRLDGIQKKSFYKLVCERAHDCDTRKDVKTLWNEVEIKSELRIFLKIMILKFIQHHPVVRKRFTVSFNKQNGIRGPERDYIFLPGDILTPFWVDSEFFDLELL